MFKPVVLLRRAMVWFKQRFCEHSGWSSKIYYKDWKKTKKFSYTICTDCHKVLEIYDARMGDYKF